MFNVQLGRAPDTRTIQIHPAWLLAPLGLAGCIFIGLLMGYFQSAVLAALVMGAGLAALWVGVVLIRPEWALLFYAFAAVNLNGVELPVPFGDVRISPDIVLTVLMLLGTLLRLLHERRSIASLSISAPYLIFLAVPIITLLWSPVTFQSAKGVFRFVGYYALIWLIVDVIQTRRQLLRMITALMISPIVPILIGAYQALTGGGQMIRALQVGSQSPEAFNRVYGLAGGPFTLAFYLVLVIPLLLVFFLDEPKLEAESGKESVRPHFKRSVLAFLLVGALISLVLTFIRGSWFALVASLVWLGFLRGSLRFRQLMFSIPVMAFGFIWAYAPAQSRLLELSLLEESSPARENLTLLGRIEVWKVAWEWIVSSPLRFLAGLGMKAFDYFYILLPGPLTGRSLYWRRVEFLVGNRPHNEILGLWLDVGLIGLAALIAVLYLVLRSAWRIYKHSDDSLLRLFATAFLTSSAGMFLGAMGDNVFSQPTVAVYFWLMAGLILAVERHLMPEEEKSHKLQAPSSGPQA